MSEFRGLGAASAAWDAQLSGGQEGRETPDDWQCTGPCEYVHSWDAESCVACGADRPEPAEYDPSIDYEERD